LIDWTLSTLCGTLVKAARNVDAVTAYPIRAAQSNHALYRREFLVASPPAGSGWASKDSTSVSQFLVDCGARRIECWCVKELSDQLGFNQVFPAEDTITGVSLIKEISDCGQDLSSYKGKSRSMYRQISS
jgi:hypothetical protein